jgi:hypothetical protein
MIGLKLMGLFYLFIGNQLYNKVHDLISGTVPFDAEVKGGTLFSRDEPSPASETSIDSRADPMDWART